MTSSPFAAPATASGIDWKALNGALLLISAHSVEEGIKTVHGDASAVRADVVALDGELKGEEFTDTLVFPKVLQGQLRSRLGQRVLGRLGQGNAKPGQSAPWVLAEATADDVALGTKYLSNGLAAPAKDKSPPF